MKDDNYILLGFKENQELLERVKQEQKCQLYYSEVKKFANQEILINLDSNLENKNILLTFFLPSRSYSKNNKDINEYIFELLLTIDTLNRMNVNKIALLISYLPYSRQDRKTMFNESFGLKMLSNMINSLKVNSIITFDLHADQTVGFFESNVYNISLAYSLLNELKLISTNKEFTIVAPDAGSAKRISQLANIMNSEMIMINKSRPGHNKVEITNFIGDPKNKDCIIIDDMIDTGGTVLKTAELLKSNGAKTISVLTTHPIFSNNALNKFEDAIKNKIIDNMIVSESLIIDDSKLIHKLSLSKIISSIMKKLNNHESITSIENDAKEKLRK